MRFKTHVLKESKRILKSYSFPFELLQFRQCIFSFPCKFCLTGSINTMAQWLNPQQILQFMRFALDIRHKKKYWNNSKAKSFVL